MFKMHKPLVISFIYILDNLTKYQIKDIFVQIRNMQTDLLNIKWIYFFNNTMSYFWKYYRGRGSKNAWEKINYNMKCFCLVWLCSQDVYALLD